MFILMYVLSYIGSANLLRHAEGATWLAIVVVSDLVFVCLFLSHKSQQILLHKPTLLSWYVARLSELKGPLVESVFFSFPLICVVVAVNTRKACHTREERAEQNNS